MIIAPLHPKISVSTTRDDAARKKYQRCMLRIMRLNGSKCGCLYVTHMQAATLHRSISFYTDSDELTFSPDEANPVGFVSFMLFEAELAKFLERLQCLTRNRSHFSLDNQREHGGVVGIPSHSPSIRRCPFEPACWQFRGWKDRNFHPFHI